MDTQLIKGVLEMCILYQCSRKDMYGYEIMKEIKTLFPDVYNASIYAILRRLHAEGYTETYFGSMSSGPKRKYYRITEAGMNYLSQTINEWKALIFATKQLGLF